MCLCLLIAVPFAIEAAKKNKGKNKSNHKAQLEKKKAQKEKDKPNTYKHYERTILDLNIEGLLNKAVYYKHDEEMPRRPLLVYLHGSGGDKGPLEEFGSQAAKSLSKFDLVCDVIQPRSKTNWKAKSIDALIDLMIADHQTDPKRIYVGGYSMGGAGTWAYGFEGKHDVAAFLAIASGASKKEMVHEKWDLEIMKRKPIWMIHGALDTVVPYDNAKATADLMEKINPNFKFTTLKGSTHKMGDVFEMKEVFAWLLQQRS